MKRGKSSQSLTGTLNIRRLRPDACLPNALEQSAASIELRWDCHRSPHEPADGPASGDAGPPADGVSVYRVTWSTDGSPCPSGTFADQEKPASIWLTLRETPVAGRLNCCHLARPDVLSRRAIARFSYSRNAGWVSDGWSEMIAGAVVSDVQER